jgi:hypothetical protein
MLEEIVHGDEVEVFARESRFYELSFDDGDVVVLSRDRDRVGRDVQSRDLPASGPRRVGENGRATADVEKLARLDVLLDLVKANRAEEHVDVAVPEIVVIAVETFGRGRGLEEVAAIAVSPLARIGSHDAVACNQAAALTAVELSLVRHPVLETEFRAIAGRTMGRQAQSTVPSARRRDPAGRSETPDRGFGRRQIHFGSSPSTRSRWAYSTTRPLSAWDGPNELFSELGSARPAPAHPRRLRAVGSAPCERETLGMLMAPGYLG